MRIVMNEPTSLHAVMPVHEWPQSDIVRIPHLADLPAPVEVDEHRCVVHK